MYNPQFPNREQIRQNFIRDLTTAMCFIYNIIRTIILFVITAVILGVMFRISVEFGCKWAGRTDYVCESIRDIIEYVYETSNWLYKNTF
jgi:hypothetical protein